MPTEEDSPCYLDDDGNKVYLTGEQFQAGWVGEEERKRREAEPKAKEQVEKEEKEWWESRQEWGERFPFEPTYHLEITCDPDAFHATREMRDRESNPRFLRRFYESRLRHTEEIEPLYDIVQEGAGEKADNPIVLGRAFRPLRKYHQAKAQPQKRSIGRMPVSLSPGNHLPPMPSMLGGLTPQQIAVYKALPERVRRAMTEELRYNLRRDFGEKTHAYHTRPKSPIKDGT